MQYSDKAKGFTIVELVLTLTLVAVLAGVASTSWLKLVSTTNHTSVINNTHRMFSLARSYAVHKRTLTTICPLSETLNCTDEWNKPISVFPDADNDRRPDGGHVHAVFSLAKSRTVLYSRTAGRGYFQVSSSGMSHGTMGSLIVCSDQGSGRVDMTYLALNIGGRLRALHDDDEDGMIRLPWGPELSCPGQ